LTTRRSALEITTVVQEGTLRVSLAGSLDIATTDQLETIVLDALDRGVGIVVDLRQLAVCDSTGLGALVRLHRRARAAGRELRLGSPRPHVADLLAMTGISKVIPVVSD
jgi:anti-sigma B factor antagonist